MNILHTCTIVYRGLPLPDLHFIIEGTRHDIFTAILLADAPSTAPDAVIVGLVLLELQGTLQQEKERVN